MFAHTTGVLAHTDSHDDVARAWGTVRPYSFADAVLFPTRIEAAAFVQRHSVTMHVFACVVHSRSAVRAYRHTHEVPNRATLSLLHTYGQSAAKFCQSCHS